MFKRKDNKTGVQTPEYRKPTSPPPPPTSGSNAVKPNPNYTPPASVTKPRTMLYIMKFEDLKDWVKTRAQIGDVAYYHDHMLDRDFIYCYRKPDDNPSWVAMDPYFLEKYFEKENKGDKEVLGTMNCTYETPCGWCAKWDKKCDKKIGKGYNDPKGKKGAIGICPNCGASNHIIWNPDTDVSTCSCWWNNDKPQRGLRAEGNVYDDNCPMPKGIIRKIIKEVIDYEKAINQLKETTKENMT